MPSYRGSSPEERMRETDSAIKLSVMDKNFEKFGTQNPFAFDPVKINDQVIATTKINKLTKLGKLKPSKKMQKQIQ